MYCKAKIHIGKGSRLIFDGRINIGYSKQLPVVSFIPENLYFYSASIIPLDNSICISPDVNVIVKKNAFFSVGYGTYSTSDMHIEVVHPLEIEVNCFNRWEITIIDDEYHRMINAKQISEKEKLIIGNHV